MKNVIVIGDVMIDTYIDGIVTRISPEAPVPILEYLRSEKRLGGAANVSLNLSKLNLNVNLIGLIGNDALGQELQSLLSNSGLANTNMIISEGRSTTNKIRFSSSSHQILRVDIEDKYDISDELVEMASSILNRLILEQECEAILISDYCKGFITPQLIKKIIVIAEKRQIKVIVDSKPSKYRYFKGVYSIKPNRSEMEAFSGIKINNPENAKLAAKKLKQETECKTVLLTLGEQGVLGIDENNQSYYLPAVSKKVCDVTGAGDTFVSAFTYGLVNDRKFLECIRIANIASSIVVNQYGTSFITEEEISEL